MLLLRRGLDRTGQMASFYISLSERTIVIETFTNKWKIHLYPQNDTVSNHTSLRNFGNQNFFIFP